jgi:hypothetical protein
MGWEAPRVLAEMADADGLYFDSLSQIKMDSVTRKRVALLGDAGYGATMGGLGTGRAVVCSDVLAGNRRAPAATNRGVPPVRAEDPQLRRRLPEAGQRGRAVSGAPHPPRGTQVVGTGRAVGQVPPRPDRRDQRRAVLSCASTALSAVGMRSAQVAISCR